MLTVLLMMSTRFPTKSLHQAPPPHLGALRTWDAAEINRLLADRAATAQPAPHSPLRRASWQLQRVKGAAWEQSIGSPAGLTRHLSGQAPAAQWAAAAPRRPGQTARAVSPVSCCRWRLNAVSHWGWAFL